MRRSFGFSSSKRTKYVSCRPSARSVGLWPVWALTPFGVVSVRFPIASIEYAEIVALTVFDVNAKPLRVITTQHGAVL